MNETTKNGENRIGREYKEIPAAGEKEGVYAEKHFNRGWKPEGGSDYERKNGMNRIMKIEKAIENRVVAGYKAIENCFVSGYKAIENGVVSGYIKIENMFVEAFLSFDDVSDKTGEK